MKSFIKKCWHIINKPIVHEHDTSLFNKKVVDKLEREKIVNQLIDSINDSSRVIAAEFSILLLVAFILGLTLVVTDDEALFFEKEIVLPQGVATMDIVNAYRFLPLVFFILHATLLSMLSALHLKIRQLNKILPDNTARLRLLPYAFLRAHLSDSYFLMRFLAFFGIAIIPLGLFLGITGAFLRYQNETINLSHRMLALVDCVLIFQFYWRPLYCSGRGQIASRLKKVFYGAETYLYFAFILFIFFLTPFASTPDPASPIFRSEPPSQINKNNLVYLIYKHPRENWFDLLCEKTKQGTRWGCRYLSFRDKNLFKSPSEEVLAAVMVGQNEKTSKKIKELKQSLGERLDNLERRLFHSADFTKSRFLNAGVFRSTA